MPKISPALEAELVATADRLGVQVRALGSDTTKMRRFTVPSRAGDQLIMLDRMPHSSPKFFMFLAPALDHRVAGELASIPLPRFNNAKTNEHRMQHSAFSIFKEPLPHGEPFGHGWMLEERRASEQFSQLVDVIRRS